MKVVGKPHAAVKLPEKCVTCYQSSGLKNNVRPNTPLLKWEIKDEVEDNKVDDQVKELESGRRKRRPRTVSARKLGAALWRLRSPETAGFGQRWRSVDRSGFQPGVGQADILRVGCHHDKCNGCEMKDPAQSLHLASDMKSRFFHKVNSSSPFYKTAMDLEGTTKWDPVSLETFDNVRQIYSHMKHLDCQVSAASMISALEAELGQARTRIQELEAKRRSSKRKMEHFLKKVSEERASWRKREHEKIRVLIDDIKADLIREKKSRQRLEIINSNLVNELAGAKVSAKQFMQDYEKERKARELIEEICDELAKEMGEDKAEIEALRREILKQQEEVDEERKMLQMAELWREERVQMKLVDAKVALEAKYSQMNRLVADVETFIRSRNTTPDLKEMREAESLIQAAASVYIPDVNKFAYKPPNPNDFFSVFEEVNCSDPDERETKQCIAYSPTSRDSKIHTVSPELNVINKHCSAFYHQNGDIGEDQSRWETASRVMDRGSSYSPEASVMSVDSKNYRRDSNVTSSGSDWEEKVRDETGISDLYSVPKKQYKKVLAIAKLWRSGVDKYKIISGDGMNGRLPNGRKSNGSIASRDRVAGNGGLSPDLVGQWSLQESSNPHITRATKGCIKWQHGAQKNSSKTKLMESEKVQLRQVLKQKI